MSTKTENVYVAELLYLIALDDTGLTNECVTVKHAGFQSTICVDHSVPAIPITHLRDIKQGGPSVLDVTNAHL